MSNFAGSYQSCGYQTKYPTLRCKYLGVWSCTVAALHWQAAIAAIKQNIHHKVVGYAHEHIAPNNNMGHIM